MFAMAAGLLMMLQPVATAATPNDTPAVLAAAGMARWPDDVTDAFRFTSILPGGRGATIFEAHRTAAGAERTIVSLAPGPDGWMAQSRETRRLADETFVYLAARIDAAIVKGAPPAPPCAGPEYLAERKSGGATRTLAGACGDEHPNAALAKLFGVVED